MFERSGYVSYANCGLPYHIGGVIKDPAELTLQTPESFYERFRVQMKVRHEVTAIHPEKKTVEVTDLGTGERFEESYDKLILSPGARPGETSASGDRSGPSVHAADSGRHLPDPGLYRGKPSKIRSSWRGGGFIGLELAENLRERGMEVTIRGTSGTADESLDPDMAAFIHAQARGARHPSGAWPFRGGV